MRILTEKQAGIAPTRLAGFRGIDVREIDPVYADVIIRRWQALGHVVVLLGNGDGSFQQPVDVGAQRRAEISAPGIPLLAVGDVNGDGKPDPIFGPYSYSSFFEITVMPGKGDGTFPQSVRVPEDLDQFERLADRFVT